MAGVTTAGAIKVEDLSKAADVLDQRQTPFWTAARNGAKLENHLIYSQAIDTMGKRRAGGVPERQDIKGFEGGVAERIYGRGERFQRTPSVSKEVEKFQHLTQSELLKNYNAQVAVKIKEQKRDINYACLSDQESQDDDGVQGYFFRGAGRWINDGATGAATSTGGPNTNSTNAGTPDLAFRDTPAAIAGNIRTPTQQIFAGAMTALTEATFTDMLQNRWARAGVTQDFTFWTAAGLKRYISDTFGKYAADRPGYTNIQRTTIAPVNDGKYVASGIDVYQGDFGTFTVELEPWMPTTQRGYGIDMGQVMKRIGYMAEHTQFEDKGGGPRGLIDSILSIFFGDPRRHFKVCPSTEVAAIIDFDF